MEFDTFQKLWKEMDFPEQTSKGDRVDLENQTAGLDVPNSRRDVYTLSNKINIGQQRTTLGTSTVPAEGLSISPRTSDQQQALLDVLTTSFLILPDPRTKDAACELSSGFGSTLTNIDSSMSGMLNPALSGRDAVFLGLADLDTTRWSEHGYNQLMDLGFVDIASFRDFCNDAKRVKAHTAEEMTDRN